MHIIDVLYNKYYLPTIINRFILRNKNRNTDFSLLTANCMGGYIYHQLGVKFASPTINLMMSQKDFYKYIANIDYYNGLKFQDLGFQGGVPVGLLGDLTINFTHYKSFDDGANSWYKRAKRINPHKLYIIATDRDGVSYDDIKTLASIKCAKLLVFTAKQYDLPFCFKVDAFDGCDQIGNIMGKTISGKWRFEKFFDFCSWLNDDDPIAEHFKIHRTI